MADQVQNWEQHHSYYDDRLEAWEWNWEHWLGGRKLINSDRRLDYLVRHDVEAATSYEKRRLRAQGLYHNLVRYALEVYQSQLFRVKPHRKLPSRLRDLEENADSMGTPAHDFFRMVVDFMQLFEMAHVLVDSPANASAVSEQERRELGLSQWFEYISPLQLIDWAVEQEAVGRRGELNYAVIRDELEVRTEAFAPPQKRVRYRVWYPQRWEVWTGERDERGVITGSVEQVAEGANPIGRVPLVTFYDRRVAPLRGTTVIDDVALKANALWNRASVEDESFHYQGFNQLVVETTRDIDELKLGQARALSVEPGEKAYYLSPSSVPTESFDSFVKRTIDQVSDVVFGRTGRQQQPSAQVESAEKRRLDREELNAILERKAGNAEKAERECWKLAQLYETLDAEEIEVEYNREFEVDDSSASEWEKLVMAGVRSRIEWYKEHHPGVTDKEAEKGIRENMDFEREMRTAAMAEEVDFASTVAQQTDSAIRLARNARSAAA